MSPSSPQPSPSTRPPRRSEAEPLPTPPADSTGERRPGTVTLLFTDQVGSTETLQRLGDEEGERLRRAHFGLLREAAALHGGEEVKNLGDGLMVAFLSALDALACAITIQQAVHSAERGFAVRIGLNVGEPIRDEGDYFGTRGGFSYRALGALALKGVAEPVAACEVVWEPSSEVRVPLPAPLAGEDRGVFVGRSDAAAALESQWAQVRERGLRVAMLAGEPGIGKTRLAREFARRAHATGATVLAGSCHEEARAPYQPLVQALRHYIACCPTSELTLHVTPRRAQLAAILPELEDARTPHRPTGLGAEQERLRLFEAVCALLADAARTRPLVLFLDDVHTADPSSLLLLRHLARSAPSAPLLLLGTYRPSEVGAEHPLTQALAELRRSRTLAQLSLTGLGEAEVAELIAGRTARAASPAFVRRVTQRSEGNPFFIEELLHDMGRESDWEGAARGVPASIKDLLMRRLSNLGDDCRQALSVAAVAGRDFELAVLERVLGHSRDHLVDLVEEAIAAEVLVEPAGSVGQLSFSHALFRETLYEQLSATRRAVVHGRIAAAIEGAMPTDRPQEGAGTLAYHYRAAGDLRKAFECYRSAAAAAERVYAQEATLENLHGAILAGEALGMSAADADDSIRELYRARAWTLDLLGRSEEALSDLEHALAGSRAAGDRASEMRVHNATGYHWHVLDPPASRRCLQAALAIAEELGDEAGQVESLNRLALVLANELEFAPAVELGERALDIARRAQDESALVRAMDSLKFAALQLGDLQRLQQLCAELARAQRQRGEVWYLQWTLCESGYVPLERCDWADAQRRIDEALAIGERTGDRHAGVLLREASSWLARCRGDYARSLALGRDALARADTSRADWLGWAAAGLASPLLDLRASDEAIAALTRGLAAAERNHARGQIFRCLGALSCALRIAGEDAQARELALRAQQIALQVTTPPGHVDLAGEQAYCAIAETHLAAGEIEHAEQLMQRRLQAWERTGARRSIALTTRVLARCAEARGDWVSAGKLLARASTAAGEDGLHVERWQIHAALARVALATDRDQAASQHRQRACQLIEAMAASVGEGDREIAARFRDRALAEIDRPGATLRH